MRKRYNTPHRSRVVKTRMTEEEYAEFAQRLSAYNMSQAEFIRQAITGAAIRPIITVSPVNDELLAAVGKLTAEYGRIGGNLNQIARTLNEWHSPYPQLAGEVRAAVSDLAALKFSEVMEMCHREGLYQIDLLNGSKERITEREYWAAKKGQLALDKENAAREAAGQPTKPTKFETDKAKLRRTIRQALSQATSFDEFSFLLLREGVTVKESRGRLSYLTPDRTKPITARKLGDDFDKAAVLALLTQNAHRAAEQTTAIPEYPHTQKERLREEKTAKTAPADNTLQRMVDREAKRAEGKGVGYDRWASLHNLKQMAATHNFLMENELLDLDKLDAAVESSRKALSEARESLRGIEQSISDKKSLRKVVNDYRRTRPTIDAHKKLSGRKAENYRQSHEAEFIIYEAALRQLKVLAPGKKLPATSKLNTEIEALISEKNAAYNTYRTAKAEYEQLATAKRNAEQILHGTPSRQKKHEQER